MRNSFLEWIPFIGSAITVKNGYEDIQKGNKLKGTLKTAFGLGSFGLDIVTFGTISTIAKGATKAGAQTLIHVLAKKGAEIGAEIGAKNLAYAFVTKTVAATVIDEAC